MMFAGSSRNKLENKQLNSEAQDIILHILKYSGKVLADVNKNIQSAVGN